MPCRVVLSAVLRPLVRQPDAAEEDAVGGGVAPVTEKEVRDGRRQISSDCRNYSVQALMPAFT